MSLALPPEELRVSVANANVAAAVAGDRRYDGDVSRHDKAKAGGKTRRRLPISARHQRAISYPLVTPPAIHNRLLL